MLAGSRSDVIHLYVVTILMGRATIQGVPAHSQGVTGPAGLHEDQGNLWCKQLVAPISLAQIEIGWLARAPPQARNFKATNNGDIVISCAMLYREQYCTRLGKILNISRVHPTSLKVVVFCTGRITLGFDFHRS